MLNKNLKLNPNVFTDNIETRTIRDGFGEGILIAGETNPNIMVLTADLSESTRVDKFRARFPERFIECGISEQNMIGVASGLASCGKIPFVTSFAIFSPGRNWEQIRTTVCYNNVPVKIIGSHAGINTGPDGATHQSLEDIALMRVLPNMIVVCPCDALEARKATLAAAEINQPVYLRLSRDKTPIITGEETPFIIGRSEIVWESNNPKILLISCGYLLYQTLVAAKFLDKEGIGTIVLNNHTLKPLDKDTIIEAARKCQGVVAIEDHQIIGGLGSAVAELLSQFLPRPQEFVGIRDQFGESGEPEELMKKFHLLSVDIIAASQKLLKRI